MYVTPQVGKAAGRPTGGLRTSIVRPFDTHNTRLYYECMWLDRGEWTSTLVSHSYRVAGVHGCAEGACGWAGVSGEMGWGG